MSDGMQRWCSYLAPDRWSCPEPAEPGSDRCAEHRHAQSASRVAPVSDEKPKDGYGAFDNPDEHNRAKLRHSIEDRPAMPYQRFGDWPVRLEVSDKGVGVFVTERGWAAINRGAHSGDLSLRGGPESGYTVTIFGETYHWDKEGKPLT